MKTQVFTRTHISTTTLKTYFSSGSLNYFLLTNHREKAVIDENIV